LTQAAHRARAGTAGDERRSRRATLAACVALAAVFGACLHQVTDAFEHWTFEARRAARARDGTLQAASVELVPRQANPGPLWHADAARPAAYLVDFIYTRCASVCSALGSEYQQMQGALATRAATAPAASAVRLVSVSFDVAHDDVPALARYAARFAADPSRWTIGVPASAADATALLRSLEVVAIPDGQGGFVHNGAIHVLDERGRLRGLFELAQWPQALAAAERLAARAPLRR
jgi:protein SCO1/2